MMKRLTIVKAIVLSCVMATVALMPKSLNAQRNDMFFHYDNEEIYNNRAVDAGITLGNYGIGEEVPLGSGLLILAAAGAGYAVARRRKSHCGNASHASKHVAMMVMAALMMLGFTQCKKQITQVVTDDPSFNGGFPISLAVGNHSRVIVDPENPGTQGDHQYATVKFESGDLVYVGYNGRCVGTLSCNIANPEEYAEFNGTVDIEDTDVVPGEHLHFYLLGGNGFAPAFNPNNTEAVVDISDQTQRYPVVSYAISDDEFDITQHTYTAPRLMNKVSMMKFDVRKPNDITDAVCITGMNNKVVINFAQYNDADQGFAYEMDAVNEGLIKMKGAAGGQTEPVALWAIVLPQAALDTMAVNLAYNDSETCVGLVPSISEIEVNKFYNNTSVTNAKLVINDLAFSVSDTKKVYFAPGNLQYIGSATEPYWKFADKTYQHIGNVQCGAATANNETIDRDLFGWGATGYGNTRPYYTNTNNSSYANYGSTAGIAGTNYDWGKYVQITNGGTYSWRTATGAEWEYMLVERGLMGHNDEPGYHTYSFAYLTVGGVTYNCAMVFPDCWGIEFERRLGVDQFDHNLHNDIDETKYALLERFGVVFLPLTGTRIGTSYYFSGNCSYWTATTNNKVQTATACIFQFGPCNLVVPYDEYNRCNGLAVRLVRDKE